MLPSTEILSRLLGAIYDASTNPTLWESFLRQLAETARARNAALVIHDLRNEKRALARSWEITPEALQLYQDYYGSIDVWEKRGILKPAGEVCTSQALCPLPEMRKTEVYNDYMAPFEFEHGMFSLVEKSTSCFAAVSLYRDSSSSEFQESDLDILRFLTPHLQRAFRLHVQISELKARSSGFEAALEMLPTAIIFLGAGGEIIFMNRAARRLTSEDDGILVTRKGLCAERPSECAELQRLIAEAIRTSDGEGLSPAGFLFVRRKKGLPLHILVAPVRGLVVDGTASPSAVVFANDPSKRIRPADEILRAPGGYFNTAGLGGIQRNRGWVVKPLGSSNSSLKTSDGS